MTNKDSRELADLALDVLMRLRAIPLYSGEIVMVLGLASAMAAIEMSADFMKLDSTEN